MAKNISSFLFLIIVGLVAGLSGMAIGGEAAPPTIKVSLVSFTAEWCPNCKVLDPKMDAAMKAMAGQPLDRVILDMTNTKTRAQSFATVNGTLYADVYGDHLGVTGIGILTAADSGEKIGCITRDDTVEHIISRMEAAILTVSSQPPYQRQIAEAPCPPANDKQSLPKGW